MKAIKVYTNLLQGAMRDAQQDSVYRVTCVCLRDVVRNQFKTEAKKRISIFRKEK